MKKVFVNTTCIILALEKGETMHGLSYNGASTLAKIYKAVGSNATNSWMGIVNVAYEVWFYNPIDSRFHMFKNKGHINEIIARLEESGIHTKVVAAGMSAIAEQIGFVSEKDEFHFKLKFL